MAFVFPTLALRSTVSSKKKRENVLKPVSGRWLGGGGDGGTVALQRRRDGAAAPPWRHDAKKRKKTVRKLCKTVRKRSKTTRNSRKPIKNENPIRFDEIQKNRNKWRFGVFRRLMSHLCPKFCFCEASSCRANYSKPRLLSHHF